MKIRSASPTDEDTRSLTSSDDCSITDELPSARLQVPKSDRHAATREKWWLIVTVAFVSFALGNLTAAPGSGAAAVPEQPCDDSGLPPIDKLLDERSWIYDELSPAETAVVAAFAVQTLGVNASMAGHAVTGNVLSGTEAVVLLPPPKVAARAYVDGQTSTPPPRFAKVVVVRGRARQPDVMEYKVGPILGCAVRKCDSPSMAPGASAIPIVADGAIPYAKRPVDMSDDTFVALSVSLVVELMPLLTSTFGKVFDWVPGCTTACHDPAAGRTQMTPYNDIAATNASRVSVIKFGWYTEKFEANWLHELPFSFRVNQSGALPEAWFTYDLRFCGHGPFATARELLTAAKSIHCSFARFDPATSGRTGDWDVPGLASEQPPRPGSTLPPPTQTCSRRRFRLGADAGGNNGRLVSWLGWSFFATVRPASGLALMDVRFKGKRIAHELALSEAAAFYSGAGADQVLYLDAAWSMTQLSADLIPGVDCPADAAFINGTKWTHATQPGYEPDPTRVGVRSRTPGMAKGVLRSSPLSATPFRAACVFEHDRATAQWRHTEQETRPDGVRSHGLIVRMVSTVGNYDYLTEFEFHADGSIKASMTFAGYCEIRWFGRDVNGWEKSLSAIAHAQVAAALHSHFASFKLDLDVLGEANSFEKTHFRVGRPNGVPDLDAYPTKYIERQIVPTEGVGVSTARAEPAIWRVVNENVSLRAHADAASPGYAILPGTTSQQLLPDHHPMVNSASFSRYNLAVTRRHESEQRAASVYDLYGQSSTPYLDFDALLADRESIRGEDLVAWVTIGKEHLPRTEDVPLITNFGTSFLLWPWDVFQKNAGMDMPRLNAQ